jgi:hypothetical protein
MRWQILIVFLFLFSEGYAQRQENEYRKMIDSAISIKMIDFLKSYESHPTGSNLGKENLYVIDENDLAYKYAGGVTGLGLKSMNIFDAKNKSVLKNGIHAWKIMPALKGGSLTISIIDFFITYKSGNYNYANGGGSEKVFEYLCNENKWALVKSKNQGL